MKSKLRIQNRALHFTSVCLLGALRVVLSESYNEVQLIELTTVDKSLQIRRQFELSLKCVLL